MAPRTPGREDARVEIAPPSELLAKVAALPSGGPLVERLRGSPGVHLVGGAVRDLLLGGVPTDLDLVVEGDGSELISRLGGRVVAHERFGTWAVTAAGFSYDIAQARRETYAQPAALPEVEPATLAEDLLRRDFTVNAIALALGGPEAGRLSAAPRALKDLDQRQLRVLHARSFIDDPTRLLRLARYRSRLGFSVEQETARLVDEARAGHALAVLSGAREGAELRLLAAEPDPLSALRTVGELGLDAEIQPEFGVREDDLELGRRALALLPSDASSGCLAMALAWRHVPAQDLPGLLDRLAFEADERGVILAAAGHLHRVANALAQSRRPSEIAAAAAPWPLEVVALAGALGPEQAARAWLGELRHVELDISGADLLAAGIAQGPAIGRGLRAALEARLDGRAEDRPAQLAVALREAQPTG